MGGRLIEYLPNPSENTNALAVICGLTHRKDTPGRGGSGTVRVWELYDIKVPPETDLGRTRTAILHVRARRGLKVLTEGARAGPRPLGNTRAPRLIPPSGG